MNRSQIAVGTLRGLIVAIGVLAVLLGNGMQAHANQSGSTVNEASEFQIGLCRLGGGIDTVDVTRTGDGLIGVKVRCNGGYLDGMECWNGRYTGTYCFFAKPESHTSSGGQSLPHVDVVVEAVEPGTVEDVEIVQDIAPVEESVDPTVAEEPEVTEEAVDPLPPVVEETPVVETVPDVDVVEENGDGGQVDPGHVVDDLVEVEVVEEPVVEETALPQIEQVPADLPAIEIAG